MNKLMRNTISVLLAAALLVTATACNSEPQSNSGSSPVSSSQQETVSSPSAGQGGVSVSDLTVELKAKYAGQDPYDYEEPQNNVEKNRVFRLELGFDPMDAGYEFNDWQSENSITQITDVFLDRELTLRADASISFDAATSTLLIGPPVTPTLQPEFGNSGGENVWGYANKYYGAVFKDPKTNEPLAKPAVTIFTVAHELEAPFVEFVKSDSGYAAYRWTPVEGAAEYTLVMGKFDESVTSGIRWSSFPIGTTGSTSYEEKSLDNMDPYLSILNMQYGVDETGKPYYDYVAVYAKNGDKTSPASNLLHIDTFRHLLPERIEPGDGASILGGKNVSDLPAFTPVRMCNGSTVFYPVTYYPEQKQKVTAADLFSPETLQAEGIDPTKIAYAFPSQIDGIDIKTTTLVTNVDYDGFEDDLAALVERVSESKGKAGGSTAPGIGMEQSNKPDSGISQSESSQEPTTSSSEKPEEDPSASNDDTQLKTTEFRVSGNSALSEYLAVNMLNGKDMISLAAFPEAQDQDFLLDAFFEALYQNPLVLNVESLALDSESNTLIVLYGQNTDELVQKQDEVRTEVTRIIGQIITAGMSDLEKQMAINEYLCENATYDYDALDSALENNMVPDAKFNDSFTPYGVLINKVGVCASYAAAFKLLADEAGLDCIVITGYLNGNLPHAWNRTNIDGQWLTSDTTNNGNPNLYNVVMNLPDDASAPVLVQDTRFVLDSKLENYVATDGTKEYYRMNGKYYDKDVVSSVLAEGILSDGKVTLRTDYTLTESELTEIIVEMAESGKLTGYDKLSDLKANSYLGVVYIGA